MKCDECGGTEFDKVWIPIPVDTKKPLVCETCLETRKKDPKFGKVDPRQLRDA